MSGVAVARFGNAAAVRDDAARLRERAAAAEDLARAVRRTDTGFWSGEASDAFAEATASVARDLLRAADDSLQAADVLEAHARTISWAEERQFSGVTIAPRAWHAQ